MLKQLLKVALHITQSEKEGFKDILHYRPSGFYSDSSFSNRSLAVLFKMSLVTFQLNCKTVMNSSKVGLSQGSSETAFPANVTANSLG